ncbi:MAG: SOS response-associated peptidase family protein [Burkholderiaceae bacterium]
MCTNYTPATPSDLLSLDAIEASGWRGPDWPAETCPGYEAPILLPGPGGRAQLCTGSYGLIPRWCKDQRQAGSVSRRTYNARSETVAEKPSFRQAWRERRWAVAPMRDFFEPCWESGRAVRWRIRLAGEPLFGAAGLQETWTDPANGVIQRSFTLLTVNADGHELMGRMHRPEDEKRMLVLLPMALWPSWLDGDGRSALQVLQGAHRSTLVGEAAPVRRDAQQTLDF